MTPSQTSPHPPLIKRWLDSTPPAGCDTLVLLLHGKSGTAAAMQDLRDAVLEKIPTAWVRIPSLPLGWSKLVDLEELCRQIATDLDADVRRPEIRSVIISGHSAGGVLAQYVYLNLLEEGALAGKAQRLVLISAMTRGWCINPHMPQLTKLAWFVGSQLGKMRELPWRLYRRVNLKLGREIPRERLWLFQIKRGAPFLVNLRLRWLRTKATYLVACQVIGSVDELISWRDMTDSVIADGKAYIIEVPFSDHLEVMNFRDESPRPTAPPDAAGKGQRRKELIVKAFTAPEDLLALEKVDFQDRAEQKPDPTVNRLVFVIHGIRDQGFWTQRIAARARRIGGTAVAVETSSYGYFSMLEFIRRSAREEKMYWLMDEFVEAKRCYPEADISYVGHSNGTYLIAQVLEEYAGVKVERLAFAGSVVNCHYDWPARRAKNQVASVLNFTADGDWVVSLFPRLVQLFPPLGLMVGTNIGGGSVGGFRLGVGNGVTNLGRLHGAHGVAIEEEHWDELADYAVNGNLPGPPADGYRGDSWFNPFGLGGRLFTPLALTTLVALLVGLSWLAWKNPLLFWIWPMPWVFLAFAASAVYADVKGSGSYDARIAAKKQAGFALAVVGGFAALWLLIPLAAKLWLMAFGHAPAFLRWALGHWTRDFPNYSIFRGDNHEAIGALRATSLGAWLIAVYKILTKF